MSRHSCGSDSRRTTNSRKYNVNIQFCLWPTNPFMVLYDVVSAKSGNIKQLCEVLRHPFAINTYNIANNYIYFFFCFEKQEIRLWDFRLQTGCGYVDRRLLLGLLLPSCHLAAIVGAIPWANMGPIWGQQDPGGPHIGPMNLAIWDDVI